MREKMERKYVSPLIETIEVEVEQGFAVSVEMGVKGDVNDFTTNNYGGGGSTMDF